MIIFVVERPTPQRNPLLDQVAAGLEDVRVFYLRADDTSRGWGTVAIAHPHLVLDRLGAWAALVRVLLSPRLTVVCLFGYRRTARVLAALVARARRIPLVLRSDSNIRDELSRHARSRQVLKRWYLKLLLGSPEVWVIGSANAAYWRLMGFQRQQLFPYGVSRLPRGGSEGSALRAAHGLTGLFVFAYVGRLEPDKGVTDLLEAFDVVRAAAPGSTALLVAGDGSLAAQLCRSASARPGCAYLGALDHERLGAVYAAADVLVVPSHREAWGLVVNEALGFGTRVIASDRVGAADDLCDERAGRRFAAGDRRELAAAMLAEYQRGARPAPVLPGTDVSEPVIERLRWLAGSRSTREMA